MLDRNSEETCRVCLCVCAGAGWVLCYLVTERKLS